MLYQKPKICTSVAAEKIDPFIQALNEAQAQSELIELRIDYLPGITPAQLTEIKTQVRLPAIVTCRDQQHGGHFKGSIADQNKLLQTAIDLGFEYIDIDLAIIDQIQIKAQQSEIILSYHNFDKTPDLNTLHHIKKTMLEKKVGILKFATYAHTLDDAYLLLQFLLTKKPEEKMIVLGMGAAGKITRLLSPLLGGFLTFAANNETQTASGQLDVRAMNAFYQQTYTLLDR
jgi:3-dehydroquinate dehydratase type I